MNDEAQDRSSLTAGQHISAEDLMLFELELLSPEEAQAVDDHLHGSTGAGCDLCQTELAAVRESVGLFALASTPAAEVPASGRARLLSALPAPGAGSEAQAGGAAASAAALRLVPERVQDRVPERVQEQVHEQVPEQVTGQVPNRIPNRVQDREQAAALPPARAGHAGNWWGWGLAAMLALVAFHFYQQRQTLQAALVSQQSQVARFAADEAQARAIVNALTDRTAQRVTLTLTRGAQPPQPTGRATYLPQKGTLIFLASHLQPLSPGKTYELWVIPASGAAPVPAGTFKPDAGGNASVVTAQLEPGIAAKAFGVTVEADGGSSTPTMPILLAGS